MHVTQEGAVVGSVDRARLEVLQTESAEPLPEEQPDVELYMLRTMAEGRGIKVDGRWGLDRLRQEIADEQESD